MQTLIEKDYKGSQIIYDSGESRGVTEGFFWNKEGWSGKRHNSLKNLKKAIDASESKLTKYKNVKCISVPSDHDSLYPSHYGVITITSVSGDGSVFVRYRNGDKEKLRSWERRNLKEASITNNIKYKEICALDAQLKELSTKRAEILKSMNDLINPSDLT